MAAEADLQETPTTPAEDAPTADVPSVEPEAPSVSSEPTAAPAPEADEPETDEPEIRQQHYLDARGRRKPIKAKILRGGMSREARNQLIRERMEQAKAKRQGKAV